MWGSQLHFAQVVIVSWHQLAGPPSDLIPIVPGPTFLRSQTSTFPILQPSNLPTFCDKLPTTNNQHPPGQQQSTNMDANDQNGAVKGTPSKKHTIEQSPRKPSPAKVSSLSRNVLLFISAWRHNTSPSPLPLLHRFFLCFNASLPLLAKQAVSSLPPSCLSPAPQPPYSLTNTVLTSATHVCPPRHAHFTLPTFCCQHPPCSLFHLEHSGLYHLINLALFILPDPTSTAYALSTSISTRVAHLRTNTFFPHHVVSRHLRRSVPTSHKHLANSSCRSPRSTSTR